MISMMKRQNHGTYIVLPRFVIARCIALAACWGDSTRNKFGSPKVIFVSTNPGLIVAT